MAADTANNRARHAGQVNVQGHQANFLPPINEPGINSIAGASSEVANEHVSTTQSQDTVLQPQFKDNQREDGDGDSLSQGSQAMDIEEDDDQLLQHEYQDAHTTLTPDHDSALQAGSQHPPINHNTSVNDHPVSHMESARETHEHEVKQQQADLSKGGTYSSGHTNPGSRLQATQISAVPPNLVANDMHGSAMPSMFANSGVALRGQNHNTHTSNDAFQHSQRWDTSRDVWADSMLSTTVKQEEKDSHELRHIPSSQHVPFVGFSSFGIEVPRMQNQQNQMRQFNTQQPQLHFNQCYTSPFDAQLPPTLMPTTFTNMPPMSFQGYNLGSFDGVFQAPAYPYIQQQLMNQSLGNAAQAQSRQPTPIESTQPRKQKKHAASRRHEQLEDIDEHDCGDISDDDEPLKTRVKRHPSILGNAAAVQTDSTSSMVQNKSVQKEAGFDPNYVESLRKAKSRAKGESKSNSKVEPETKSESKSKAESKSKSGSKPKGAKAREPTPVEQAHTSSDEASTPAATDSSALNIDWKLPTFVADYEPGKTKHDPGVARVSIPGLVREELLLSPDHADQELQLLLDVFLPGQQNLEQQDPEPAHAVLNFHTIAVMVIEAFVHFEIGDELGKGRGHWHEDHDQGDKEYERIRDAKDANTDDIFFAVIDRWRTGLETNKQPCKVVRGAQEFCDIALDIIFYIKEHGLLKQRKRAQRSDKGAKRSLKKEGDSQTIQGTKRATPEVNEVQARKKPKGNEKTTKAPKKKVSTSGVTVMVRKK